MRPKQWSPLVLNKLPEGNISEILKKFEESSCEIYSFPEPTSGQTYELDPEYGKSDRCYYDFDKNMVIEEHCSPYATIFQREGVDVVSVSTVGYIAKMKVENYIDRLVDRLCPRYDLRQQQRHDIIIYGYNMPITSGVHVGMRQRTWNNSPMHFEFDKQGRETYTKNW